MSEPTFAMLCCACGAEKIVKEAMAADGWRLAFSRPGFVTAKHDEISPLPEGAFVRTASKSIGSIRHEDANELVRGLIEKLESTYPAVIPFDQLHVWPKDRAPIGRFDFEPGEDEVSKVVADQIYAALKEKWLRCDAPNRIAQPSESVLDVILVEPSHWFFGTHTAATWPTRWPGGVQPMHPKHQPISRAYYKAAEAITWSGFDLQPGDLAIEIGSAPGGACSRLLELGMRVIGIDPADMDERIMGHPKFRHIKARGGDLPRKDFRGAKWMLVDSNVKPAQSLVTVGNIVTNRQSDFRGLLMTMKIGEYESAGLIDQWVSKIKKWNPKSIRVRQLARNKIEVCIAVEL
ncbi:MAG: SAM-dependent methyltransferase [Rubripirellula sp.]